MILCYASAISRRPDLNTVFAVPNRLSMDINQKTNSYDFAFMTDFYNIINKTILRRFFAFEPNSSPIPHLRLPSHSRQKVTYLINRRALWLKHLRQPVPRMRMQVSRNLLRRALRHNAPAALAALRSHIDYPIRRLDHIEVVLDHDQRPAAVDQLLEAPSAASTHHRSAAPSSAHRGCRASRLACDGLAFALADRTAARCAASFTRCASPPESVVADCPSRR